MPGVGIPHSLPFPMNSSLSPTSPAASLNQPTHSLTISLIGFPQMTVLVSEHTATNSLPQLQHWESPASSGPVSQSAVTLPIEFCQLLAMQFLPTAYHLAPLLANINQGHQTTVLPCCFASENPTITIPPGGGPPPTHRRRGRGPRSDRRTRMKFQLAAGCEAETEIA